MISSQTAFSSQSFVRALKAPSDPPQPDGPPKIEIARETWDNTSFYVPNKGEVIVDWLLTKLLKDKAKGLSNPTLHLQYWALLADVVSPMDPQGQQTAKSRPPKTWLTHLLNRIPIIPIIITFLSLLPTLPTSDRLSLTPVVRRCLAVLWPLSVPKVTSDTLLECFVGVMKMLKEVDGVIGDDNLMKIGEMVVASFRSAFGNASNKKKMYLTFTQTYLLNWLECTGCLSLAEPPHQAVISNIYTTGTEILFTLDILRQMQTQSSGTSTFTLPTNLQTLFSTHPSQVLSSLPRLFKSFIQSIRKHRGTLFNQSSSSTVGGATTVTEVRRAGMAFFASCMALVDQTGDAEEDEVWETRIGVLEIVDQEMLFSSIGVESEAEAVFRRSGDVAIEALVSVSQENRPERTRLTLIVLSTLMHIDCDLIVPSIPRILPKLLLVTETAEALRFLDLLLDYHTKTRTMHTYISTLLCAISNPSSSSEPRSTYKTAFSSPLLNLAHLDRLSKCTLNFLTPGQTMDTVIGALDAIKRSWDVFWEAQEKVIVDSGEGSRKKRKTTAAQGLSTGKAGNPDAFAIAFTLSARISTMVFSSLPLQSLPESTRFDIQRTLAEAQTSFIQLVLQQAFEVIRKNLTNPRLEVWGCQVGAAALLRLNYGLIAAQQLRLRAESDEKMGARMLDVAGDDGVLPELSLEIFRNLLSSSTVANADLTESHIVLESLLHYLERHSAAVSWSGLSCHLTFGKSGQEQTALALLHLLIDRWLPAIDLFASRQHLERLSQLIIAMKSDDLSTLSLGEGLQPSMILNQTLRSAQFWEILNTRNALLSSINVETSALDKINTAETQSLLASPIDVTQLRRVISAYELLLYIPIEYIPRTSRQDLIRRAVTADLVVCRTMHAANSMRSMTILRVFLKRWLSYHSSVDHAMIQHYVQHLITSSQGLAQPTSEVLSVTLDLVGLHISTLLRSSAKTSTKTILDMISSFSSAAHFDSLATDSWGTQIMPLTIMRFLELVTTEFSRSDLSDTILSSIQALYEVLFTSIARRMSILVSDDNSINDVLDQSIALRVWCNMLSFGRWLQTEDSAPPFGKRLVAKIISGNPPLLSSHVIDHQLEEFCSGSLAILLDEFHRCAQSSRLSHLDVVIATYVSFCRISEFNGWRKFDLHFSETCKALPVSDFSHILDLCWESLSNGGLSPPDLTCLVHLSTLLLHEAPQGTLKVIQGFTTHSLNLFASHPMFYSGPLSLRLRTLDFVVQHCSERLAALRSLDLSGIWLLLSKLLSGSEQHDATTSAAIFHHIVTIISSIIRLRRDLVVCTLPHLGMILRQLIMVMRQLRPQLGAKQSKLVTDTLPVWVNAVDPLAAEEGRALARLLTTLTSKSIVRTHQPSSADSQKAESLAKPFSKHAAFVLKAYVDAMNDPLCVMPLDIRKELRPGLFSLCDMISEHSRDALMVSALDAGGKATMKALWKEYEKQRYVGKG